VPLADDARGVVAGIVVFLALLMVSTVRYRTFKNFRPSRKSAAVLMLILAGGVVIAKLSHPAWVLVAIFAMYLMSGMVESIVLLGRHLKERRAAAAAIEAAIDDDDEGEEDDVDEQEVM
jgi:CDP-diacylglycerol--serine O-phosphatidyltransferase